MRAIVIQCMARKGFDEIWKLIVLEKMKPN